MLLGSIALQTTPQADVVAPWDLPVYYWLISAVAQLFLVFLVIMWARSGRDKHEKRVTYDRSTEDYNGAVQSGFGAVPIFLVIVWVSILLWITSYIVISIITGVRY